LQIVWKVGIIIRMYIARTIETSVRRLATEFPSVTVLGPRQSGKTTLVRNVFHDYMYVTLELPDIRILAEQDPRSFLERYKSPVIIDEIQRVPSLLSYIQVAIDEDRQMNGRYIFTGSHQPELRNSISQSLAGRTAIIYLLPLSIDELSKEQNNHGRDEYIFRGFMPQLYEKSLSPTSFYRQYYQTYVERDMRQLAHIRNLSQFEVFLRLLAGRVGNILNLSDLSNATGMSVPTIKEWINILEASFIVFRLRPYFDNFGKRLIKSPKIYFTEPGLAAYLLGVREVSHITDGPFLGQLFENMVVVESLKTRFNNGEDSNLYFYRDNNGLEVDMLIDNFQTIHAVEIKASRSFSEGLFKNLFRTKKISPKFASGTVIYAGEIETGYKDFQTLNFRRISTLFD
jgi:uncharacterized protein